MKHALRLDVGTAWQQGQICDYVYHDLIVLLWAVWVRPSGATDMNRQREMEAVIGRPPQQGRADASYSVV